MSACLLAHVRQRKRSAAKPPTSVPTRLTSRLLAPMATVLGCLLSAASPAHVRNYYFEHIGPAQGLAQNTVGALLQGDQGFMWIGTQGGLHRFDGYHLQRFHHDADRSDSLPDNVISALASDGQGHLWVASKVGGLVLYDPQRDRVLPTHGLSRAHFDGITALSGGRGKRLLIADHTAIHALGPGKRPLRTLWRSDSAAPQAGTLLAQCGNRDMFYGLHGQQLVVIGRDAAHTHAVHIDRSDTRSLLCRSNGSLLLGTASGIYHLDPGSGVTSKIWPDKAETMKAGAIDALVEDHDRRIWAAVESVGLLGLDPDEQHPKLLQPQSGMPGSLPDITIRKLYVDRSGLVWTGGVTRGASYFNPDGAPFRFISDTQAGNNRFASNNVRALYEDDSGRIWLGLGGSGLHRYDPTTDNFDSLTPLLRKALSVQPATPISVFALARDGHRFWLATDRGPLTLDPSRKIARYTDSALASRPVRSLLRTRDGKLWLGMYDGGGVYVYGNGKRIAHLQHVPGKLQSLAAGIVVALAQDPQGRVWIGTSSGLSVYDPASGSMRTFHEQAGNNDSLSSHVVMSLLVDHAGQLWVGTQSGLDRLISLDASGAHFNRITSRNGLPDDTIYCMREDAAHNLWLSTNRGVVRLNPVSGKIMAFTVQDGLQGMEYNSNACLRTRRGNLIFGGVNGFDEVDPARIRPSSFMPQVAFTGIHVSADEIPVLAENGRIAMRESSRSIRFDYAAMDFTSPRQNRFRHRLTGFDRHWIDDGNRHSATYTNLPAGHYQFEVQGSNHSGLFSTHVLHLDVTVIPPWWATRMMYMVYALLAILLLLALYAAWRARRIHERKHQEQLREREGRLSMALWGSGDAFWDLHLHENRLYRMGADQLLGEGSASDIDFDDWCNYVIHPDDLELVRQALSRCLEGDADHFEAAYRLKNAKGEWIWVLGRGKIVGRDAHGKPSRISGTARDITRVRSEDRERRIATEVIRSMSEAVAVCDLDFRFSSVNAAFTSITGYSNDEVRGRDTSLLNCIQQPDSIYAHLRRELQGQGHWRGELWQRRKNGSDFLCWVELREVCNAHGQRTHYVAVMTDITDRKRAEQELRYLANYDMLTGLPNRTLLGERLADAILRARRNGHRLALLYVDLDRFKHVNDSMGHTTGDRLLKAAGIRLRQCVREQDTVARVGGDEFTVVLEDMGGPGEIIGIAHKIINAFTESLALESHQEILISPSIGISMYPDHGQIPNELLKHADTAMYQAKEHGRNTWMVYNEAMDADAHLRATMAGALRRALERNELSLVYQPKLTLDDHRVVGVEALIRWHNEELGKVPPTVFIPLAEETGMIMDIGQFVLDQACRDLRAWREQGLESLTMAVNLSMVQLQRSGLAKRLRNTLLQHGLPAQHIELELTESTVMANVEQSMRTLGELREIGFRLAIDDFGTGYSSLSYLKRLPLTVLKIDQAFVGDITTDPDDEAITATIIAMAHSLGLQVVAEGVETSEQAAYLKEHDCDLIQGNWLSPPLTADKCLAFCRDRERRRRFAKRTQDSH